VGPCRATVSPLRRGGDWRKAHGPAFTAADEATVWSTKQAAHEAAFFSAQQTTQSATYFAANATHGAALGATQQRAQQSTQQRA